MEDRKLKYGKKWIVAASVFVLILFCLFFFRVKKVTVEGNTFFSETDMAEMFQSNILYKNVLTFWVMDKLSLTPEPEFVREYEISYPSVNEIHIKLYEKGIVAGIFYMNQYIYFDKDGMVLQSTQTPVEGIPLFETGTVTTFTMYQKVQMEDESLLSQIMNLSNLFQHYQIKWDKVQFNDANEAVLYSGMIKVKLGKKDNYDEEISALSSILETALRENMQGEIDLTNYAVKGTVILEQPKKK